MSITTDSQLLCKKCGREFSTKQNLQSHINRKTPCVRKEQGVEVDEHMEMVLTGKYGGTVLYSQEDHEKIAEHTWCISDSGYCRTMIKGKCIRLHRFITDISDDKIIDHINGNRLDNRQENLRITIKSGNAQNRRKSTNTETSSQYVGVAFHAQTNKYISYININKKRINLGSYVTEQDAAIARDMYIIHEMPDALYPLNFPNSAEEYKLTDYIPRKASNMRVPITSVSTLYEDIEHNPDIIRLIVNSNDSIVLIDRNDYELVKTHTIHIRKDDGYVMTNGQYLHRLILNVTDSRVFVDHIDNNKLNNTRINLRLSNPTKNAQNMKKRTNTTSKYKGVSFSMSRKKWVAAIMVEGKSIYLGRHDTEESAARFRDNYIRTNFPDSHYTFNFPEDTK